MSYVYFARCGRYVKIGFSDWPEKRVRRLLTAGPLMTYPDDFDRTQPIELIRTIGDCVRRDEGDLHVWFAEHHAAGEWFHATDELLHLIDTLEYKTVRRQRLEARRAERAQKIVQEHGGVVSR